MNANIIVIDTVNLAEKTMISGKISQRHEKTVPVGMPTIYTSNKDKTLESCVDGIAICMSSKDLIENNEKTND